MKDFFKLAFLSLSGLVFSQQTSVSPYSALGIGEYRTQDGIVVSSMGRIGTAYVPGTGNEINFSNPAANFNIKYSVFGIGGQINNSFLKDDWGNKANHSQIFFNNLSLGFPITPVSRVGLELIPLSSSGYETTIQVGTSQHTTSNTGGITSLNLIYAHNLTKDFALGGKVGYNFGAIHKNETIIVEGAETGQRLRESLRYNFVRFQLGADYRIRLKENKNISLGATYMFAQKTNTKIESISETFPTLNPSHQQSKDTLGSHKAKTHLPMQATFGAMYERENKWGAGVDFLYSNQSDFEVPNEDAVYTDKYRLGVGGWYIPNINGYRSYFQRIVYRGGAFYEKMGMEISNESLDQYGVTLGFGLPLGKQGRLDPSVVNLAFEAGQRGKVSQTMVKENFVNIRVGFQFTDRWFNRRKFD